MEIFGVWLLFSIGVGVLAASFGRGGFLWFLLALIFTPLLAVIALLVVGRARSVARDPNVAHPSTHVLCPDCAEPVRNEAKVCKHCGCRLTPLSAQ